MTHPSSPNTVDVSLLAGVAEIAERYDVKPPTVCTWRTRYADFPKPVTVLSQGPVYLMPEVVAWHSARHARRNSP